MEKLLDVRTVANGRQTQFLVRCDGSWEGLLTVTRWEGFGEEDDSWEFKSHITQSAINEFYAQQHIHNLSDFEKERECNVRRNQELLESLSLCESQGSANPTPKRAPVSPVVNSPAADPAPKTPRLSTPSNITLSQPQIPMVPAMGVRVMLSCHSFGTKPKRYPGTITSINADGTYDIECEDGDYFEGVDPNTVELKY